MFCGECGPEEPGFPKLAPYWGPVSHGAVIRGPITPLGSIVYLLFGQGHRHGILV